MLQTGLIEALVTGQAICIRDAVIGTLGDEVLSQTLEAIAVGVVQGGLPWWHVQVEWEGIVGAFGYTVSISRNTYAKARSRHL